MEVILAPIPHFSVLSTHCQNPLAETFLAASRVSAPSAIRAHYQIIRRSAYQGRLSITRCKLTVFLIRSSTEVTAVSGCSSCPDPSPACATMEPLDQEFSELLSSNEPGCRNSVRSIRLYEDYAGDLEVALPQRTNSYNRYVQLIDPLFRILSLVIFVMTLFFFPL